MKKPNLFSIVEATCVLALVACSDSGDATWTQELAADVEPASDGDRLEVRASVADADDAEDTAHAASGAPATSLGIQRGLCDVLTF